MPLSGISLIVANMLCLMEKWPLATPPSLMACVVRTSGPVCLLTISFKGLWCPCQHFYQELFSKYCLYVEQIALSLDYSGFIWTVWYIIIYCLWIKWRTRRTECYLVMKELLGFAQDCLLRVNIEKLHQLYALLSYGFYKTLLVSSENNKEVGIFCGCWTNSIEKCYV